MKKVVSLIVALFVVSAMNAQVSFDAVAEFNKQNVPAVSIILDQNQDITCEALQKRFEKDLRLKGTNEKGFRAYKAQVVAEFGPMAYDVYTLVEVEGKNKKAQRSKITVMVSSGNENFLSNSTNPELIDNVKKFLNAIPAYVADYDRQKKLDAANEELTKVQKEFEKEESKIASYQDKIKESEAAKSKLASQIQKLKETIGSLQK